MTSPIFFFTLNIDYYGRSITQKNIRTLWEKVTDGVCDNIHLDGKLYRSGMVTIGNEAKTVHTPATPERLPDFMEQWFQFREQDNSLIGSFVAHFYFVYVHPFCDGNGRTARIINASSLYHAGWKKMKSLPLSNGTSKDIRANYAQISALTRQKPVCITLNGKENTFLLSHKYYLDQIRYISELEAKLAVYPHLAQAMDDIKLGRVQSADSAFADILGELENLDV